MAGEIPTQAMVTRCVKAAIRGAQESGLPPWLSVWLLIIADNTLHLICNGIALAWLV